MNHRRVAGMDLGIATAHTVRVLDGEGAIVAKRKAWPTVDSLIAVETAALAGCPADTRLEVVIEPTGPAWLPVVVFFSARGHRVSGGSRRRRPPTCAGSCRGTPRATASTPTPWPGCRWSARSGCGRCCCPAPCRRRWTGGSAPPTGSPGKPLTTSGVTDPVPHPPSCAVTYCYQRTYPRQTRRAAKNSFTFRGRRVRNNPRLDMRIRYRHNAHLLRDLKACTSSSPPSSNGQLRWPPC
jgi:hypothetical protein